MILSVKPLEWEPRKPEPVAHCYRCEMAVTGKCLEYKALNPQYSGGYDRKGCHWGAEHQLRMILVNTLGETVYDSDKEATVPEEVTATGIGRHGEQIETGADFLGQSKKEAA